MKTPKINAKKLAAALAPLALAGAVIAPAAAASTPPSAQAPAAMQSKVGYSKGFPISNHSNYQIKLINITGDGHFEGRPADGTVLKPGESTRVEVQFRAATNQVDEANFQILDWAGTPIGTFTAHMALNPMDLPFSYCEAALVLNPGQQPKAEKCTPEGANDPDNGPWNKWKTDISLEQGPAGQR